MDKLRYLVETLSRTSKKDYENYVVNAIWNRLGNNEIQPVTQQYVDDSNGNHYFIDLYFPAINVGIECDEAQHSTDEAKVRDSLRDATIYDELNKIELTDDYHVERIDVTQPFEAVEQAINRAVAAIKDRYERIKPQKWVILTSAEYFAEREEISIGDKMGFSSINEACNVLFGTSYSTNSRGPKRVYFTPSRFRDHKELDGKKIWFPKIAIQLDNGATVSISKGWNNQLANHGQTIYEFNEQEKHRFRKADVVEEDKEGIVRVVFAKQRSPLGQDEYRFIGQFQGERYERFYHTETSGKRSIRRRRVYKRISETCCLIKN
jgi:very-short-patch-repair endonuclease